MPCNDPLSKAKITSVLPRGFLPHLDGGLELTADRIARSIARMVGSMTVLAGYPSQSPRALGVRALRKLRGPYPLSRRRGGYTVRYDPWHPVDLEEHLRDQRPDVLVCHLSYSDEVVEVARRLALPTVFTMHSQRIEPNLGPAAAELPRVASAGQSAFVNNRLREAGLDPFLLPPTIDAGMAELPSGPHDHVLVVNPDPKKGGDILAEVARRMPHRRFLVAGGWKQAAPPELRDVEDKLAKLLNVERRAHFADIREAFARARMLFFPCRQPEAYGRIVAEAQAAGIPVLASDVGALEEVVGTGGIALPPERPVERWMREIDRLFESDAHHAELAKAGRQMAALPERAAGYFDATLRRILESVLPA